MTFGIGDLAVVIPSRDRWDILGRTVSAVREQGGDELEVIVVVDGDDQNPPPLDAEVMQVPRGGPGAARNRGVERTDRPLVLFLGDDMIPAPGLIDAHVGRHRTSPGGSVAVLGRVTWHPEVGLNGLYDWIDRSGIQFDFGSIADGEAGWNRFYSCNVSMKRSLFEAAGGFDPDFVYYYEDLDAGWRLHQQGMTLLYEPSALTNHLHRYDLGRLRQRFAGVARGEQMMADKHPWFEPWFEPLFRNASRQPHRSAMWRRPELARASELLPSRVRNGVARRQNLSYLQELAPSFLEVWDSRAS